MKLFKLKLVLDFFYVTCQILWSCLRASILIIFWQKVQNNQPILQNYQECVGHVGHSWVCMVVLGACAYSTCGAYSA